MILHRIPCLHWLVECSHRLPDTETVSSRGGFAHKQVIQHWQCCKCDRTQSGLKYEISYAQYEKLGGLVK